MYATSSTRRDILALSATAGVLSVLPGRFVLAADDNTIRSFKINVPEEQVVDLRRRIAATRWPDRETVADQSQGVQLAKLQELVRYWGTDYDWRKIETKLNALPQFVTTIDGVDIHFIHVRSRNANALPVIITHGWPGSVIEQLKSSILLRIQPRTETAPRMHSTSSSRLCRAMASPAGRPVRVGTLIALREPGLN